MRRTGLRTAVYTSSRVLAATVSVLALAGACAATQARAQASQSARPADAGVPPAAPPPAVKPPSAAAPAAKPAPSAPSAAAEATPTSPTPATPADAARPSPTSNAEAQGPAGPDEPERRGPRPNTGDQHQYQNQDGEQQYGYPPPGQPYSRHRRYGRFGMSPQRRAELEEQDNEQQHWDPWSTPLPARFTHEGFFLRLNFGPAYGNVWRPDYRWTGLGLGLALSVGASIIENLSLHADFRGTLMSNPTQRTDGRKSDFNADIVFQSMGIGATYYIMPWNIYASLGAGVGVLSFEDDDGASKGTSAGLTVNGMVGKEWWVASDWGLGIAAQLLYTRVKDYVDDRRMHGITASLLFSATYN